MLVGMERAAAPGRPPSAPRTSTMDHFQAALPHTRRQANVLVHAGQVLHPKFHKWGEFQNLEHFFRKVI